MGVVSAKALILAFALFLSLPGLMILPAAEASGEERSEPVLIDPLVMPRDGRGDVRLTLAFDVSPEGVEALIPHDGGWIRYVEAATEAAFRIGVQAGVGEGLTAALGLRAGVLHERRAAGLDEAGRLVFQGLRWTEAALHYETARTDGGRAKAFTLRALPGGAALEAGVTEIRDPLVLFGGVLVERAWEPGREEAVVGASIGAAFVVNERVAMRGTAGIKLPLKGAKAPLSTLAWRTAYQLDARGRRELAFYAVWSLSGQRPRAAIGVEWTAKLAP